MSVFLTYLKTNVRNIVAVVFMVLALFFGARFDPLKEPTITLLTGIVNTFTTEEAEVKAVEVAPDNIAIVPAEESAAADRDWETMLKP